uniref:Uncharacterized protein n=1 Tax=Agrobacterium tumefaciens TaxID=358 RepID=A0A2P0QJU4_AGRTU|nr:hypothetical protein AgrTiChry5_130 [Agrobacterium tumefaciens]
MQLFVLTLLRRGGFNRTPRPMAVAAGLDILKGIAVSLASASRSVEILQFLASEARRVRPR